MKKAEPNGKTDPHDYSDEAERKVLRLQLYNDLKWQGGPAIYPSECPSFAPGATDKDAEPSLEEWRRGYLVLKSKLQQQFFWLQTITAFAAIVGGLWMFRRFGFL